jgi:hypothetical protein
MPGSKFHIYAKKPDFLKGNRLICVVYLSGLDLPAICVAGDLNALEVCPPQESAQDYLVTFMRAKKPNFYFKKIG